MVDDKTPAAPSTKVNAGNVFTFDSGILGKIATIGDAATNTQILVSTPPRGPKVSAIDLSQLLGSEDAGNIASAGLAGIENGATGVIATGAKTINKVNDAGVIGQHLYQVNGAELITEGAGMAAGAGGMTVGALAGAKSGAVIGGVVFPPSVPITTAVGTVIGGGIGAFGGTALGKYLGGLATGGDTPDKLGPPLTLPSNTPLEPTVIGADGSKFALVNVEGKYTWFAMLDNKNLATPNQFIEVVSGAKVAELTNSYLGAPETGFAQQVKELATQLDIAYQNQDVAPDLRADLRQTEIATVNAIAPNGKPWGESTKTEGNATETLTKGADSGYYTKTIEGKQGDGAFRVIETIDTTTGKTIRVDTYERGFQNAADSFKITSTRNYETGTGRELNRETGKMDVIAVPKNSSGIKTNTQVNTDNLDPTNPASKDAVNGLDKQSDDAAAKREGEEAGKKYGDFGEDLTQSTSSQANTDSTSPFIQSTDQEPPDGAYQALMEAFMSAPATPPLSSGINVASLGGGIMTDGGLMTGWSDWGSASEPSTNDHDNIYVENTNADNGASYSPPMERGSGAAGTVQYRKIEGDHTRYVWDEQGQIRVQLEGRIIQGGTAALGAAQHVLEEINALLVKANAGKSPEQQLALNPHSLPRIASFEGQTHVEFEFGGKTLSHSVSSEQLIPFVLKLMQEQSAIVPAWQAQTLWQHEQASASLGADTASWPTHIIPHAQGTNLSVNDSSNAEQQTFSAIGISLSASALQALQASGVSFANPSSASSTHLTDIDGDGYLEQTQSLAHNQPMLVIDSQNDGRISGAVDNVNLGQAGNGLVWLDGNQDGVLDKHDPAFAAIKLWLDVNGDGQSQSAEQLNLAQAGIESIDLINAQIHWTDGRSTALVEQQLSANVQGIKRVNVLGAHGEDSHAGQIVEIEARAGERPTYGEHDAIRTGDWEGTNVQEVHRHGGGNVEGSPTQTTATGSISIGQLKIVSQKQNVQQVITVAAATTATTTALGFVPLAVLAGSASVGATQQVTDGMIQSVQSNLFGLVAHNGIPVSGLGLTVLGSVGTGMAAVQTPVLTSATIANKIGDSGASLVDNAAPNNPTINNRTYTSTLANSGQPTNTEPVTFVVAGLTNFQSSTATSSTVLTTPTVIATVTTSFTSNVVPSVQNIPIAPAVVQTVINNPVAALPAATTSASGATVPTVFSLEAPQAHGETLAGTEDIVLRLPSSALLANDTSRNSAANPNALMLTIIAVSSPTHGQVGLNNGINGTEVVFIPDPNFHGTATFTYMVTDQYGLQSTATATLEIAAVNDASEVGASPNKGGRVQGTKCSAAKCSESSPDPLWLGRVADRAMTASAAGLSGLEAANDVAYSPMPLCANDASYLQAA